MQLGHHNSPSRNTKIQDGSRTVPPRGTKAWWQLLHDTASNYGAVGFARVCTPESWLSTWSGLSSNALLAKTAPSVVQPTLLIEYTGDQCCFPSVIGEIAAALGTTDLQRERVRGDHHGRALATGEEAGRYVAGRMIAGWLHSKFPA